MPRAHALRLSGLLLLLVVCVSLYMGYGIRGSLEFALTYRGEKLAGLLVVALSISTSTVLFHTITGNRILTPSIMGFDALYVMILSLMVFLLGSQTYVAVPEQLLFVINASTLLLVSFGLFATLLGQVRADIMRMVLTGIIAGVMFRSLSSLVQRLIDPSEFAVVAANSFARFSTIDAGLLWVAAPVCLLGIVSAGLLRHRLDVLALGPEIAINLGEDPRKLSLIALVIVSLLVSTATALVGPVAFLGLLVVNLAHLVTPTPHHGLQFLTAGLVSAITLVGGQTIMERLFHFTTPLSVIVDLIGGLVFLFLVFSQAKR
ncbi:iron chelate uptake ABC transporter family permease subunit [uncultured Cohaesibacter sp.]|uniref:iron chelate uptake ABC transporter family permease subunit n=1 Tax=uncultured Cohaesibacter sp. TaxID=1002546 RepID=UPI0029C7E3CA|nr:iron chelate uptake ABC transporter family permease subunit [uncultured Cohaesibacter sp.]